VAVTGQQHLVPIRGTQANLAGKCQEYLDNPASRSRVHEVINRRRELTLNMIRRPHEGLGIPAESLIKIGQTKVA
jgi:antitoxin component HigA of HigAB toxin-antitoxin module